MVTSSNWRSVFPDSGSSTAALNEKLATTTDPSVCNQSVQTVGDMLFYGAGRARTETDNCR